ncbi:MAG TPA: class I SAM-dependent methyltransferase [Bdellovibrionales bacterium]|nr:class I SAM-dependent methyltransferase [Bdellovibrionales bacterium]
MKMKIFNAYRAEVLKTSRGRILEIGFGTGVNLRYYPTSIKKITVIEPNPGMTAYARENSKRAPIEVERIAGVAENIPISHDSFDTVVSTLTLCSVKDPAQAASEIFRVLKPGGRFLFFEHGLADKPSIQAWQHRLNAFNKVVADGCNINRDMRGLLESAGFRFESFENFYLPKGPKTHGFMYKGIAVKP